MAYDLLRVSGIVDDSIVDGPGLRLAVFVQGCPHRCPGCHNPDSHDPAGGYDMPISEILSAVRKNPLLSGVTLTGGEPMAQAGACAEIARALPSGLTTWVYSGYAYEELLRAGDPEQIALLDACDVLVDGRFLLSQRSLSLRFRGSANQRLIDLAGTRAAGRVVLWEG